MRVSFDPLQSSIPQDLRVDLQSDKSKANRLRWMALAGAKLPNSDELVLRQLLRSAPRKALSNQRQRYVVEDSSEIGIALHATSKRLKIDLSHSFELLCVVFWQSMVPEQNHPTNALPEPATGLAPLSSPRLVMPEANAIVVSAASERTTLPIVLTEHSAQNEFLSFFQEN
jgi:hypothetical protein